MHAINVLRNEHRSIAAVLNGLSEVVRGIGERGEAPNFDLLGAIVYYMDAFPERCHHPKENRYLFRLLRMRAPASAPLVDRLEHEHRIGALKIRALEQALERYRSGGAAEFPAFAAVADDFVAFNRAHMHAEDAEAIPLAREHLTTEDWVAIDVAFAGHSDPLVGIDAVAPYNQLFSRIVNLAPPPLGVGPSAEEHAQGRVRA